MSILNPSPFSLNFGSVQQGNSVTQILTIVNTTTGSDSISVFGWSINNPDFSIISGLPPSFSVGPGTGGVTMTVQYTASGTLGPDSGNLTFQTDADDNPLVVPLSGTSISSGKGLSINPTAIAFPSTKVNQTSSTVPVIITSTGSVAVTVQIPVINGPFVASGLPVAPTVLNPGNTLTFQVGFAPTQTGLVVQANGIVITSDAPEITDNIQLSGQAVPIFPAYIAIGGTENGFFAIGPLLRQFESDNFDCEEFTNVEKLLLLSGPGQEDCILRVELQYFDRGRTTVTVTITNEHGQQDNQELILGTSQTTGVAMNQLFDLKIEGELLTMSIATDGPLDIIAIIPRFQPAGEVKKTSI